VRPVSSRAAAATLKLALTMAAAENPQYRMRSPPGGTWIRNAAARADRRAADLDGNDISPAIGWNQKTRGGATQ
jgi:hypothetical protein